MMSLVFYRDVADAVRLGDCVSRCQYDAYRSPRLPLIEDTSFQLLPPYILFPRTGKLSQASYLDIACS
jgi:hypothetical protein